MFQLDINFIAAFIAWICIYVFVTNFRAIRRVDRFYSGHSSTLKCIHKANVTNIGIAYLRASLANLSIGENKPTKHRLSLLERWVKVTNQTGVKRTVTEQAVVVNHYLETHTKALENFRFKRYQVEVFLKHVNETIAAWELLNNTQLSQIQRIHWTYLILMELGKRFKLDITEVFVLRPLYAELFKGLPRVSPVDIDRLASEALETSGYGNQSATYSTAMGLKMIYFYSPAFNSYRRVKELKSATKF